MSTVEPTYFTPYEMQTMQVIDFTQQNSWRLETNKKEVFFIQNDWLITFKKYWCNIYNVFRYLFCFIVLKIRVADRH